MEITSLPHTDDTGLLTELAWLEECIQARVQRYFNQAETDTFIDFPRMQNASAYHHFIAEESLGYHERFILIMAIATYLKPQIYDIFHTKNPITGLVYSEFGGVIHPDQRIFIPTFRTAIFLWDSLYEIPSAEIYNFSDDTHIFWSKQVLDLAQKNTESFLETPLRLSKKCLHERLMNKAYRPEYSSDFPAKLVTTNLQWEDLMAPPHIQEELNEIRLWIENENAFNHDTHLTKWLKPGYRALFYGPSGTGKTLTVCLIGKVTDRSVYRVDLSLIVSKYIGETEKNLAKVFNMAENNRWILFFDEADALFGKRTTTSNANDRYANQEVAYLLQRIEDFPGVVILATNLQTNIDEAFSRRFQIMVPFTMPTYEERVVLWNRIFSKEYAIKDPSFVYEIAKRYELSGGMIINILRTSLLQTLSQGKKTISPESILYGIRREYEKMNKTM
jgi:hypothetical protein